VGGALVQAHSSGECESALEAFRIEHHFVGPLDFVAEVIQVHSRLDNFLLNLSPGLAVHFCGAAGIINVDVTVSIHGQFFLVFPGSSV